MKGPLNFQVRMLNPPKLREAQVHTSITSFLLKKKSTFSAHFLTPVDCNTTLLLKYGKNKIWLTAIEVNLKFLFTSTLVKSLLSSQVACLSPIDYGKRLWAGHVLRDVALKSTSSLAQGLPVPEIVSFECWSPWQTFVPVICLIIFETVYLHIS